MSNYRKTMREAMQEMYIVEDNVGILRDIVKKKSMMPVKFSDGIVKVDLFTASAVVQVLDKVNPANREKITKMINTGKKSGFSNIANIAFKAGSKREETDLDEASKLPPHLAKFFDKDGNLKKDAAARIAKGQQKLNIKDVTPKGYGPSEEVELDENLKQMKKHINDIEFDRKRMTTSGQESLDKLIKAKKYKRCQKSI